MNINNYIQADLTYCKGDSLQKDEHFWENKKKDRISFVSSGMERVSDGYRPTGHRFFSRGNQEYSNRQERFAIAAKALKSNELDTSGNVKKSAKNSHLWTTIKIKNKDGDETYVKVNKNSLCKRLGISKAELNKAIKNDEVTELVNKKIDEIKKAEATIDKSINDYRAKVLSGKATSAELKKIRDEIKEVANTHRLPQQTYNIGQNGVGGAVQNFLRCDDKGFPVKDFMNIQSAFLWEHKIDNQPINSNSQGIARFLDIIANMIKVGTNPSSLEAIGGTNDNNRYGQSVNAFINYLYRNITSNTNVKEWQNIAQAIVTFEQKFDNFLEVWQAKNKPLSQSDAINLEWAYGVMKAIFEKDTNYNLPSMSPEQKKAYLELSSAFEKLMEGTFEFANSRKLIKQEDRPIYGAGFNVKEWVAVDFAK